MKNIFLITISLIASLSYAKVLLITHHYNQPKFIEIQSKTFKKFMLDDYEFVVFNDSSNESMAQEITNACNKLNIRCIRIPQEIHNQPYLPRERGESYHRPNIRHVNVVQYSLNVLGFEYDGIVGIIDSDMFLVRPLSIIEYMKDLDIASCIRSTQNGTIRYLWPGLCFLHMDRLPKKRTLNFNCGRVLGINTDSGGWTYFYLKDHPEIRFKQLYEFFGWQLFCPDRLMPPANHLMTAWNIFSAESPPYPLNTPIPRDKQIVYLKKMGFNEKEIAFLQKKPDTIHFLFNNRFLHFRAGTNYDNQSTHYMQRKMNLVLEYLEDIMQD